MGTISILDESVSNQIAAGEVVERPASVAKELIENALDAGATRIAIQVRNGGVDYLSVSDDGYGMSPEDAALAFELHATSKLQTAEQLFGIKTLGFRGEALPSIASVARVELITRQHSADMGTRVVITGGEVERVSPWGAPPGTTVRVADLFFNTPARRSFLRSTAAEGRRVRELVAQMAIAAPNVAFRLEMDERIVLETAGNNSLSDTLMAIYGRQAVEQLLTVRGGAGEVRISGMVSRPEFTRNNRRDQIFVLNGRLVQSRTLGVILGEAYRSLLPKGRHPLAFLYVKLPPETVDVNVHPTKTEVRLREERQVASLLLRTLRTSLELAAENGSLAARPAALSPRQSSQEFIPAAGSDPIVPVSFYKTKERPTMHLAETAAAKAPLTVEKEAAAPLPYRLLGQIMNSYIAIERDDGFWLVDQHASHERIIYEQLTARDQQRAAQTLLVPYTFEANPKEAAVLEKARDQLAEMGFDLEHFGGRTWLLRSLPTVYRGGFRAVEFSDLLADLADGWGSLKPEERREEILIRLSCQAAIKAGQRLHNAEMIELLDQLWQTGLPYTCPHGRPTALSFSAEQLFRMFHP